MAPAWFMLYFWATLGQSDSGWFSSHKPQHASVVQQARRAYATKQACLDDIPRIVGTFDAKTEPGEIGIVCVEGMLR